MSYSLPSHSYRLFILFYSLVCHTFAVSGSSFLSMDDEDLFAYRKPKPAEGFGPNPNKRTAHVAPVNSRRPDDAFMDRKPQPASGYGPDRSFQSRRYDPDFFNDRPGFSAPSGDLLDDLIDDMPSGPTDTIRSRPTTDSFAGRSIARNPSPESYETKLLQQDNTYQPEYSESSGYGDQRRGQSFENRFSSGPNSAFRDPRPGNFASRGQRGGQRGGMRGGFGPQRNEANRNVFDRSMYPAKGQPAPSRQEDVRNRPAVYELAKIPKVQKTEEELNEKPEDKITRLRIEHAKLEMTIQDVEKTVERIQFRCDEIRGRCRGASLADDKNYADQMKFLTDSKRRLDTLRQEFSQKDEMIKRLTQKPSDSKNPSKQVETLQMLSTDFLEDKREEREEEVESSAKFEFFDGADHWCQQCNVFSTTIQDFLAHLQSEDHWSKKKPGTVPPWPLIKRASCVMDQERTLAASKGSQFMIPCHGFYCAICKVFQGDSEAAEEHILSVSHNKMFQRFVISKPEYEHIYGKDKADAKSKAEAELRKQKRDAEDRRIREEEAKRKALEEENKKREMEIREQTLEKKRQAERQRELEEKREKDRLRKDRENRLREKEREEKKREKRRNRVIVTPSSDEESSSDSEKSPTPEDPKLMCRSFVQISDEDMQRALAVFESRGRMVVSGRSVHTASSTGPDVVWKVSSINKATKPAASAPAIKPIVTVEFSDDSNDAFSLATIAKTSPVKALKQEPVDEPTSQSKVTASESPKKHVQVEVKENT